MKNLQNPGLYFDLSKILPRTFALSKKTNITEIIFLAADQDNVCREYVMNLLSSLTKHFIVHMENCIVLVQ